MGLFDVNDNNVTNFNSRDSLHSTECVQDKLMLSLIATITKIMLTYQQYHRRQRQPMWKWTWSWKGQSLRLSKAWWRCFFLITIAELDV